MIKDSQFKTVADLIKEVDSVDDSILSDAKYIALMNKEYISKDDLYKILAKYWAHDPNRILDSIREEMER